MAKKSKECFAFCDEWLKYIDLMSAEECKMFMLALKSCREGMDIPTPEDRYMAKIIAEATTFVKEQTDHREKVTEIRRQAKLKSLSKPNKTVEEPVEVVEVHVEEPEKPAKKFVKPSMEEVVEYFFAQGAENNIEAIKFYNRNEAQGWKVGKNPMKDWKAAIRYWMSNVKKNQYGYSTKFERQVNSEQQLGRAIAQQCADQLQQESRSNGQSQWLPPSL